MKKEIATIGFLITWFAIITQFSILIKSSETTFTETIIRFFSYFTILTNTLVALYFTHILTQNLSWFGRRGALTAITTFIIIVSLVYQIVLRNLWSPTGWQQIVDELLHTVIPLYMFVYWLLIFRSKTSIDKTNFKMVYIPCFLCRFSSDKRILLRFLSVSIFGCS